MKATNLLTLIDQLHKHGKSFPDFEAYLVVRSDVYMLRLWRYIENCKGSYTDSTKDRKRAFPIIYTKKIQYSSDLIRDLVKDLCKALYAFILKGKTQEQGYTALVETRLLRAEHKIIAAHQAEREAFACADILTNPHGDYVRWQALDNQLFQGIEDITLEAIEEAQRHLHSFSYTQELKYTIEKLAIYRKNNKNSIIPKDFQEEIDIILKEKKHEHSPLHHTQVLAIQCFLYRDFESYLRFKESYLAYFQSFRITHRRYLLISLINVLYILDAPNKESKREYVFLYRFGITHDLLIEHGEISSLRFTNIIFVAESFGDYELIRLAHDNLVHCIFNPRDKEQCQLLSAGIALFGEQRYGEAKEQFEALGRKKNLPFDFSMHKHVLLPKCIYEYYDDKQEAYNQLVITRASLKKMAYRAHKRGDIDENTKQSLYNYGNIFCKIANPKDSSSKEELLALFESYNGLISESVYILEKINKLP